jgi:hypothetical protein
MTPSLTAMPSGLGLMDHIFNLVKTSIYLTKLAKHASLKAPPDKKYLSEDAET